MNKTLSSCIGLFRERAEGAGVSLIYNAASNPPALYADELKFKQILINLLSNAIDFTPSGGTITIGTQLNLENGFAIQITDTGIGIAPENIPKALAPFQQIKSDLDRSNRGTGLGLSLTKSLTELHGGSLDIQSEVGMGTTVTVHFPAEQIMTESVKPPTSIKNSPV